jgi:transcriptional regulator with XRE-family HTH domain
MTKKTLVNTSELGSAVRRRREAKGLSLRDLAVETGVSASTLSRIENGAGKPDADNIARLASWLDMPIERVMHHGIRGGGEPAPVIYYPHESTPEVVEAHLRADRNLTPKTAKALSELFRVAYAQFSGNPAEKQTRKRA